MIRHIDVKFLRNNSIGKDILKPKFQVAASCLVRRLLLLLTKVVFDAFSVHNFTVQFMATISKNRSSGRYCHRPPLYDQFNGNGSIVST